MEHRLDVPIFLSSSQQVARHTDEDVTRFRGDEVFVASGPSSVFEDLFFGLLTSQQDAPFKHVDQLRVPLFRFMPCDEVFGQADANQIQTDAAAKFDVEDRQRDRHPLAVVDD